MTSRLAKAQGDIWRTDPVTLRDVVLDRDAMEGRLTQCPALERVWILCLLDRTREAIAEGLDLLAGAADRLRPLLVLAQAYQRQYSWHEAALLHEEALRLARTPAREALVRRQIGRRLFDEARYREAAAEFEWARDLYRNTSQREHLAQECQQALNRARQLAARPSPAGTEPCAESGGTSGPASHPADTDTSPRRSLRAADGDAKKN